GGTIQVESRASFLQDQFGLRKACAFCDPQRPGDSRGPRAAILAADVLGYSRLMGRHESGTLALQQSEAMHRQRTTTATKPPLRHRRPPKRTGVPTHNAAAILAANLGGYLHLIGAERTRAHLTWHRARPVTEFARRFPRPPLESPNERRRLGVAGQVRN